MGDDRLVARVRAGDDAAFEIIYDRYYRGLLAFCGQMLGSRHEAEDALQHSFASAYRALRAGVGDIDLRPWLYTIARNRCLSALRAQRAQVSAAGLVAGPRLFEGMSAQVQLRADLRELVDELQRLPDDQRAALVLFELGDESHEQIAAVLGVRREKVKALVFQAREALMRARDAREAPCVEIREQLATVPGRVSRRGMARSHIDRCPGCAEFEREVRRQRTALAAILPLAPTVGLKGSVLGFALGGSGAVALGGAGGGATVAAGGALAAGGVGGGGVAGSAGAAAAGAIGTAGAATVATGLATGGGGLASLPAKGVVAKFLAVVALGGGEAQVHDERPSHPVVVYQSATRPAPAARIPTYPPAAAPRPASSAAVDGSPTAVSPASAASSPPPAPAPATAAAPTSAHPPATLAPPAPAPSPAAPSSPAPVASDASAPASAADAPAAAPSPDPAPASAPASAASPSPAAATTATQTDASPPATAAITTVTAGTAPAAAAPTDGATVAAVAAPAVDPSAVAAVASASTTP